MERIEMKMLLVSAVFAGSILGASQIQDKGMSSIYMGTSKASYNYGSEGKTKISFGGDFMMPLQVVPNLFVGIGVDIVGIDGYASATESYGNYTLGGQLKIGYSLASLIHWNVNLKAEGGYGVTRYSSTNNWGSQYGASIDTKIYSSLGVGYKYKHVNMGIGNASYNANIFYAEIMF